MMMMPLYITFYDMHYTRVQFCSKMHLNATAADECEFIYLNGSIEC